MIAFRVLFLDIDGVLNTNDTIERGVTIDPARIDLIGRICAATGASLVLSSSWRLNPQNVLRLNALGLPIADTTIISPRDMLSRGQEIQLWLNQHPETEKYAIIDDDIDMLRTQTHSFFHCPYDHMGRTTGLTADLAERVIRHLNAV